MYEKLGIDELIIEKDEVRDMLVMNNKERDMRILEENRRLRINNRKIKLLIKEGYMRV